MERLDPGETADLAARARDGFLDAFGVAPEVVGRAPGRVNVIGDHTDYNAGLCLPVALPHATYVALGPADSDAFRSAADAGSGWDAYPLGVLEALRESGRAVSPSRGFVVSSVPLGAGLSSSAALECATGAAAGAGGNDLIEAAIRAERDWVGAMTGGMDQAISVLAEPGHALLLDFNDHSRSLVPFDPAGLALVVVDTGVSHALSDPDGGYAARRLECERAAELLGTPLRALGRADLGVLDDLPASERRRARHVVTENARVTQCVAAIRADRWDEVGRLMTESHASMRDDFQNSCPEIDAAVEAALGTGALGARMTGGGFGGSMVALLPEDRIDAALAAMDAALDDRARWLLAPASAGASLV